MNERCKTCHHEHRMHYSAAKAVGRGAFVCFATDDCRCEDFVPSGAFVCEDFVKGDYRSPNGAHPFSPPECQSPARFRCVRLDGEVEPFDVCGRHVHTFRKLSDYYRIEAI